MLDYTMTLLNAPQDDFFPLTMIIMFIIGRSIWTGLALLIHES